MAEPVPGDLIVYWQKSGHGVARVDLVRPSHLTSFPWCADKDRFDRRRFRIPRAHVIGVVSRHENPADLAAQIGENARQRAVKVAAADAAYRLAVQRMVAVRRGQR